jgi:hypothetical protein
MTPGWRGYPKVQYWVKTFNEEKELAPIIADRIADEVGKHICETFRKEWDREIIQNLDRNRKALRPYEYDARLAALVYDNSYIAREEKRRRWDMLDQRIGYLMVDQCDAIKAAPNPEGWHMRDTPKFTEEMWNSVEENWDRAVEAIEDILTRHLERVKAKPLGTGSSKEKPGGKALNRNFWHSRKRMVFTENTLFKS